MKNAYPEKQIVPYKKTSIEMPEVVIYMKNLAADREVKRAAYVMFRMESGNGQRGINNNYIGAQADSGRWADKWDQHIVGVVQKGESMTGNQRLFIALDSFATSIALLIDRVERRGLYVGGITWKVITMEVESSEDFAQAYYKEWVTGDPNAIMPESDERDIKSMYTQAEKIFL